MNELKYERIESDLYGIVERLKEIDDSYFVLRERKSGRLELHCRSQRGKTHALFFPRKTLDCRDIELVLRTRRERADKLIGELERENREREKRITNAQIKKAESLLHA